MFLYSDKNRGKVMGGKWINYGFHGIFFCCMTIEGKVLGTMGTFRDNGGKRDSFIKFQGTEELITEH